MAFWRVCRAAVARLSQAQAVAGGGGGNLLGDMPEFMLPFLIFLLAHHPDYPTEEVGVLAWQAAHVRSSVTGHRCVRCASEFWI